MTMTNKDAAAAAQIAEGDGYLPAFIIYRFIRVFNLINLLCDTNIQKIVSYN